MEAAVLDQLRLQEGKLFQSENVVAFYLDIKAVVNDALLNNISLLKDNLLGPNSEAYSSGFLDTLVMLSPKGIPQYHDQSLFDCVKTVAKLLWPNETLLIERPKLKDLFQGMLRRILKNDSCAFYSALDPIKQDFVIREAFRRTLVNDCLRVFQTSSSKTDTNEERTTEERTTVERTTEERVNSKARTNEDAKSESQFASTLDFEIGPDDSASQIVDTRSVVTDTSVPNGPLSNSGSVLGPAPYGARSVIGRDEKSSVSKSMRSKVLSVLVDSDILTRPIDTGDLVKIGPEDDARSASAKSTAKSTATAKTTKSSTEQATEALKDTASVASMRSSAQRSEMPRIHTAKATESVMSSASVNSTSTKSTLTKPLRVRKISLETDP